MVNLDEPPFLAVGTPVSAKYKGAFCEAKIRKISKTVKCKVLYSNGLTGFVTDEVIKGVVKVGSTVEVKCPDKKEYISATIQKVQDSSQYTVVFDDGDITCLKRTALCIQSGKHFAASDTLDQLPLTHPEHISAPVRRASLVHSRRGQKYKKIVRKAGSEEKSKMEEKDIGKVICVESNDKKKIKDNWFPGLVVAPTAQSSVKTNISQDYLVRSFKDGKYYTVPKKDIIEFTKEIGARVENPTLKTAVEKATYYLDKDELPPHWDRDLIFGLEKNYLTTDSEGVYDSDNSDEESIEEKDHFVAQLYKFMDDRGTPLNDAPVINDKDVDLYKLFKVVNNMGGYNKVNKYRLWKAVSFKLINEKLPTYMKHTYQTYLHSYEDFYRKLGCTMLNHPRGVRSRSRFSRSLIRDIDKALPSTSTAVKNKQKNDSKNKSNSVKENETSKDPVVTKKAGKTSKLEEKHASQKNKDEPTKKNDKKKYDAASHDKYTVKWGPHILETKDSKTKKEDINEKQGNSTNVEDKKKKNVRNLFGKSTRKPPKKEKVVKVKTETGLNGARKIRTIKEQIKTFVKVMTPFKKPKRGAPISQQDTSTKPEDEQKLTRSKSKEDLPNKHRRTSVLSDNADSSSKVTPAKSVVLEENQSKTKKTDEGGSEKKKSAKKIKEEKVVVNYATYNFLNSENVPVDLDSVDTGDMIEVFYGEDAVTYDAKVLNRSIVNGTLRFFVHYKGWNARYDEWIDSVRVTKNKSKSAPELDNDADSSKSLQKNIDSKKAPPTSRIRRSITPSTSNSQRKKSPLINVRPTRTCTLLNDRQANIDNSDSDSEFLVIPGPTKQYSKRNQAKTIKSEPPDIEIKTEVPEADNQKKTLFPKTYPSKEVLMQRNVPRKSKSCVFKINSNKSEEVEICEQVTLKPSSDFSFEVPPPCDEKKPNLDSENVKVKDEVKIDECVLNESKKAPNHYLSPKEKSEKNDQKKTTTKYPKIKEEKDIVVESSSIPAKAKSIDNLFFGKSKEEEGENGSFKHMIKVPKEYIDVESSSIPVKAKSPDDFFSVDSKEELESIRLFKQMKKIPKEYMDDEESSWIPVKVECTDDMVFGNSEEEEESIPLFKQMKKIPPPLDEKDDESKISGTDFDLNKIRSEMKGLVPTPTNSNIDLNYCTEPILNQQVETEKSNIIAPATDDIYEFKDSEPCELKTITSVIDDKHRRVIKHTDAPKSDDIDKAVEPSKIIESVVQVEVIKQNLSVEPYVSDNDKTFPLDDNVEIGVKKKDVKENPNSTNDEVENSISHSQLDNESNGSENLVISDVIIESKNEDKIYEESQNETCAVEESDIKDQVLDLCMKPPESPPNNIFSMPEANDIHDMAADDEDDDDDELKLVIAENDKIETDYQTEIDLPVVGEEHNSSHGPVEGVQTQSPQLSLTTDYLPLPPSIHKLPDTDSEFKSSYVAKKEITEPKESDDESTTSCNESIQNALIQSFQKYSQFNNQNIKLKSYETFSEKDDSTKSGFEFESNSKSPKDENVESSVQLSHMDRSNDKQYSFENEQFKDKYEIKYEKESAAILPELQCREEIVDEDAIVSRYNHKLDIYKPSTSKGFFDSIHQPGSRKDDFYEAPPSEDLTNKGFLDERHVNLIKSVIYDANAPCTRRSIMYDDPMPNSDGCNESYYDNNVPSTSKSSFYENSMPSSSKSFYHPEPNVSNVLFCEETIPGSPTGTTEEQYDQEEKKRALAQQALFEEREAASAMYAMNRSFRRPMITLMGASEKEMEEYNDILQNDGGIVDQRHLQFLAEISSRNLGINIDEPPVTEPLALESEPDVKPVIKSEKPEKPQTKRKNSSHEYPTSKRTKTSSATETTIEKPPVIKIAIPMKDGKPLIAFSPDMDSTQRQALISAKINDLRKEYIVIKGRIAVVDRRRKKIRKRKREMAKLAANQNKLLAAVK